MLVSRRLLSCIGTACFAVVMLAGTNASIAQQYPTRGVRIVLPFPAGGGADLNVRKLADQLTKIWSQPVVVDNIPGAAGGVAAVAVANSKPDGYTLFFATDPIFDANPFLYDKLQYDPEKDFKPIVRVSEIQDVLLVNPSLSVSKVSELIALAKARPGSLNFGSGGVGTSIHLAGEMFKAVAGIEIIHIPYKGSAPAISALMSNEIHLTFDGSTSAIGRIRGGRLRGLAIASMTRLPIAPDLPTFDESGLRGFVAGVTYGLLVPAMTPPALVSAINRDVNTALRDAEFKKQMNELGVNLLGGTPEELGSFLASERKRWGALIRKLGIKGE